MSSTEHFQAWYRASLAAIKIGALADSEAAAWQNVHDEAMTQWPHNLRQRRIFESQCSVGRVVQIAAARSAVG